MNKIESEIRQHLEMLQEAENKSSIEKAQIQNVKRIKSFFYGMIIWLLSYSFFSSLRGKFQIIAAVAFFVVDYAIYQIGKSLELELSIVLKIRLTVIYLLIIIFAMIFPV
jgi:lipopolysaccharide export LptBFGC system permease protein LptF